MERGSGLLYVLALRKHCQPTCTSLRMRIFMVTQYDDNPLFVTVSGGVFFALFAFDFGFDSDARQQTNRNAGSERFA